MFWFLDDLLGDGILCLCSGRFLVWFIILMVGLVVIGVLPLSTGVTLGVAAAWFLAFTVFWHVAVGWRSAE